MNPAVPRTLGGVTRPAGSQRSTNIMRPVHSIATAFGNLRGVAGLRGEAVTQVPPLGRRQDVFAAVVVGDGNGAVRRHGQDEVVVLVPEGVSVGTGIVAHDGDFRVQHADAVATEPEDDDARTVLPAALEGDQTRVPHLFPVRGDDGIAPLPTVSGAHQQVFGAPARHDSRPDLRHEPAVIVLPGFDQSQLQIFTSRLSPVPFLVARAFHGTPPSLNSMRRDSALMSCVTTPSVQRSLRKTTTRRAYIKKSK